MVALAVALGAGSAVGAGEKATVFPVGDYLTDVTAGRLFLGGDPPKIVGLKTVKEFPCGGGPSTSSRLPSAGPAGTPATAPS